VSATQYARQNVIVEVGPLVLLGSLRQLCLHSLECLIVEQPIMNVLGDDRLGLESPAVHFSDLSIVAKAVILAIAIATKDVCSGVTSIRQNATDCLRRCAFLPR